MMGHADAIGAAQAAAGAMEHSEARFAQALRDPLQACPAGLHSWNGSDPAPRFAVYRNNIVVSLVDGLAEQFPVCLELVGAEFFRAMARVYVQERPLRTRLVVFAGAGFADFIAQFPPAASVPYLADMARLEMARIRSCHAADAPVLGADAMARVMAEPDRLAQQCFVLHPSVQLLSSRHAVFALWAAHQGACDIAEVDPDEAQRVVVFRDGLDVQTLQITGGACALLRQLQAGATLGVAADAAARAEPGCDLAGSIALLLRHPLVTRLEFLP